MIKFLILILFMLAPYATWAGEKSLYDFIWLDPDKKVYVLQNKLYKKEYSFYFDAGYIVNETSKFQDTRGLQLKTGWYFHEEWAIEILMNKYSNSNNDDYDNVRIINDQVPFVRRFNSTYGLLAIWSPFYGKINTFNDIFYFDWSFGAGIAAIEAESNLKSALANATTLSFEPESYTGVILKTDVKFHVTENVHLGIGYMTTFYKAPSLKSPDEDKIRTNSDFIFSIGYSI